MTANMQQPQQTAGHGISAAVQKLAETDPRLGYLLVCALLSATDADDLQKRFSDEDREALRDVLRERIRARGFKPAPVDIGLSFARRKPSSPIEKAIDYFRGAQDFARMGMIDWRRQDDASRAA